MPQENHAIHPDLDTDTVQAMLRDIFTLALPTEVLVDRTGKHLLVTANGYLIGQERLTR
jgi:hypothetical protein